MILGFWILSKALSSPEIWGFKVTSKIWHFCLRFCPYLWPSREITAITKNLPIPSYTSSLLHSLEVIKSFWYCRKMTIRQHQSSRMSMTLEDIIKTVYIGSDGYRPERSPYYLDLVQQLRSCFLSVSTFSVSLLLIFVFSPGICPFFTT